MTPAHNRTALYIAAIAALLAIAGVGGDNASETVTRESIAATNAYAHYQAKATRATVLSVDDGDHAKTLQRYEQEKAALEADGKRHESAREAAIRQDQSFDRAIMFLQLAIVLATAWIVAAARPLIFASGATAAAGATFMAIGYAQAGLPL